MKRSGITITFIVAVLLSLLSLTACFNTQGKGSDAETARHLALTDIRDEYTLEDMREFGLWSMVLPRDVLRDKIGNCKAYFLTIDGRTYSLRANTVDHAILMCSLPETLSEDEIRRGEIITTNSAAQSRQIPFTLSIEKLIIVGETTRNSTNTYELSLTDYIDFKTTDAYLVYDDTGSLIRPSFIKTNEENAYSMKRYYDAKQMTRGSVADALNFLEMRDNHESLLYFGNANRVSYDATITYRAPDERDRIRQLGSRGELNGSNTFNIVDDESNNQFLLSFDQTQLSEKYDGGAEWLAQFKEATELSFSKVGESDINEMTIPFSDAPSTECVLNARFSMVKPAKPVTLMQGDTTEEYDTIVEAVSNINTGSSDPATLVLNSALYQEGEQITLSNCQPLITIQAAQGTTPVIDGQKGHRLFYITDASTVTFKGITFKNGYVGALDSSNYGGAIYSKNTNMDIQACTFASNTVISPTGSGAGYAGALYYKGNSTTRDSLLLISDTVFDGNGITGTRGNPGGAIQIDYTAGARIDNSTFKNNYLENGYGGVMVLLNNTGLCISNSVFSNNRTEGGNGGAIYSYCDFRLENSTITHNQAAESGGGIYSNSGLTIVNCDIMYNTAGIAGGGILAKDALEMTSALIAENTAVQFGGGICKLDGYGDPWSITTNGHSWIKSDNGTAFNQTDKNFSVDGDDGKAYEYTGENPHPVHPVQVYDNSLTEQTESNSEQYYSTERID